MSVAAPDAPAWPRFARRTRSWGWALALVALVLGVYANTWNAPWLFDDAGAVLNNPTIRQLSWRMFVPPADGSTTTGRPLVNASYALNFAVSGEAVWSYHVANVLLHALAAVLLFGVLRRFRADTAAGGALADRLAFAAAALWAVHPLLTETVVCVAQRTEGLAAVFYLAALYGFVRATTSEQTKRTSVVWLAVSSAACALGALAKETIVTAPILILLYDRTFVAGSFRQAWRRRAPYYASLCACWLVAGALVVAGGGSRGVAAGFGLGVSPWSYLLTQCHACVLYVKLAIWPSPLVLDYGTAVAHSVGDVLGSAALVVAGLGLAAWALVRRPVLGFGAAAFILLLAPSSSFVPLVTQTIAEHRMYLPLALIVVPLVVGVPASRLPRPVGLGTVATLVCGLGALTLARNATYGRVVGIWADTVVKRPASARAHNNLGWALQASGDRSAALAEYAQAVQLDPKYVTAHYNFGVALLDAKQFVDAAAQFRVAVQLAPEHVDAYVNLGTALMQLGQASEAAASLNRALRIRAAPDIRCDLAVALVAEGHDAEARDQLRDALREDPAFGAAKAQLAALAERAVQRGVAAAQAGDLRTAGDAFAFAIATAPDNAEAHANLGNVRLLQGDVPGAIAGYQAAIQLRPDEPRFRESLAEAQQTQRAR